MKKETVPNRNGEKAARCSLAGGILGILSIPLNIPFVALLMVSNGSPETRVRSILGPMIPRGGIPIGTYLLELNVAGGLIAAVTGFTIYDRLMHGGVSSSISSSRNRNQAKLMILSGMLIIAGTIAGAALVSVGVFVKVIGWGDFAELFIGLAISVLASVTLRNIS